MSIHDFIRRIGDLDQRIQSIQQYFGMMRSLPDADDDVIAAINHQSPAGQPAQPMPRRGVRP